MDEMKLNLSTRLMRGIVSKLVSKAIYKKTGYKVNVQFNEIAVNFIDGETNIKASVEAILPKEEFNKIIKSVDLI